MEIDEWLNREITKHEALRKVHMPHSTEGGETERMLIKLRAELERLRLAMASQSKA